MVYTKIDLLEQLFQNCPFPYYFSAKENSGLLISISSKCISCKTKICFAFGKNDVSNQKRCHKGLSFYQNKFGDNNVAIFGIDTTNKLRQNSADDHTVRTWIINTLLLFDLIHKRIESKVSERMSMLHDVKTVVNVININIAGLLSSMPGKNSDEKLESSTHLKKVYKSVKMLNQELEAMSIIVNPEAARFGDKHATNVYKTFDMFTKLFEDMAISRKVTFRKNGNSHNKPLLHDSFLNIPLILLDNAIKYSEERQDINIFMEDIGKDIAVCVDSFGFLVPDSHSKTIFEKGKRYIHHDDTILKGSGFGLYIAQIVAKAHKFEIKYKSRYSCLKEGKPWGTNSFFFTIPSDTN